MDSLYIKTLLLLLVTNLAIAAKVCLTGSTVKSFPKYGDAFVNGALLANDNNDFDIEFIPYDSGIQWAKKAYLKMVNIKCSVIIGFSTGNDLISINKLTRKYKVPVLSIYGDINKVITDNPYIKSFQASPEYLIRPILNILKENTNEEVLIITTRDKSSLDQYRTSYVRELKKLDIKYKTVDIVENTNRNKIFSSVDIQKFKKFIILTRSAIGAWISDEIVRNIKKPLMVGTKYFGSSSLPALHKYSKNLDKKIIFSRQNCFCSKYKEISRFKSLYLKKYKIKPMVISISSYSAIQFLRKVWKNYKSLSLESMNKTEATLVNGVRVDKGLRLLPSHLNMFEISKKGYFEI